MNRVKIRILSLLLAIVMACGFFPLSVLAEAEGGAQPGSGAEPTVSASRQEEAPGEATSPEDSAASQDPAGAADPATESNDEISGPGVGGTPAEAPAAPENAQPVEDPAVTGISLSAGSKVLRVGASFTLQATLTPAGVPGAEVLWESASPAVATVQGGLVRAVAAGTAVITARVKDTALFATCTVTVKPAVSDVRLNATAKTLRVGGSVVLWATVSPTGAYNTALTWASNSGVAAVSAAGSSATVRAQKAGSATITCTSKDDATKKATCKITVKLGVSKVKLNKKKVTLKKGKTVTLKISVQPKNAFNKKVSWKSSKTKVVSVKAKSGTKAVVKGKRAGRATITVRSLDNAKKKATCKVTVKPGVKKVALNKKKLTLYESHTAKLKATVKPKNAITKKVSWKSGKTSVATVSPKKAGSTTAIVTAHSPGSAVIRVTTKDNKKKATCRVTVLRLSPMRRLFGIEVAQLVAELSAHEGDRYYLGTPYKALGTGSSDPAQFTSPNGAPNHYGPGMNCAGFVASAMQRSGANLSKVAAKPGSGVANATNWNRYLRENNVEYYCFNTINELLASGKASKGDIFYREPLNWSLEGADCHIGIFWGNSPSENRVWHTIGAGNVISGFTADLYPSRFYIFKMG